MCKKLHRLITSILLKYIIYLKIYTVIYIYVYICIKYLYKTFTYIYIQIYIYIYIYNETKNFGINQKNCKIFGIYLLYLYIHTDR